jgi:hypothetical protein
MVTTQNFKKFLPWGIFLLGLFFQFCAFLTDHSESIPAWKKIVWIGIRPIEESFDRLENFRKIEKGETGFMEFSNFVARELRSNPEEIRQKGYETSGDWKSGFVRFEHRISKESEKFNFSDNIQIRAFSVDGGRIVLNRDALKNKIQTIHSKRLVLFAIIVFLIGTVLEFIAFILEKSPRA